MIRLPGKSYRGPIPPLTEPELALKSALFRDLYILAGAIGERNMWHYPNLVAATEFLAKGLTETGYPLFRQGYKVAGKSLYNLELEIAGTDRANEIVIVGAHYDSVSGSPGANDNATGAVAVLALARVFAGQTLSRTLRFVEFVNEEPPYFNTPDMGSSVYANSCWQRQDQVVAMLSLETIGYYTEKPGSQNYPPPLSLFYPATGNFIAFVGNISSRKLVKKIIASFRRHAQFPSEGAALPEVIPGVAWSDQLPFWNSGYPAVMVTDTAPFRYPHYHTASDTPDKVTYDHFARVVAGLEKVIAELVQV